MSLLKDGFGKAYSVLSRYYENLAEEDGYEEWGKRVLKLAEKYAKGKKMRRPCLRERLLYKGFKEGGV